MSNKVTKKTNLTQNLEQEVIDMEKELEKIKEAHEKGNIDPLTNLRIKNLKSTKISAKMPKKLSEKEKEKRDEIRRLREAEDLAQIQQRLFKQVKGRKKIEPLYKKNLYSNADVFGANIEKECEKVFPKEEKSKKIEIHTSEVVIAKNSSSRANINKLPNMSNGNLEKVNISDRKNLSKKYKINMENNMELDDELRDKEYLNKLDKEIKKVYLEQCGTIFNFLKDIYLVRFIDEFIKVGKDIFEEFIEIPDDFFLQNPFLNKYQQQKFYNKLHSIRNKYKPQYTPQNFRINQNENKINISNGNMKEDLLNLNDNERIISYINSRISTNPNRLNDKISIKNSLNNLEHLKQKTNTNINSTNTKKDEIIKDNNNKNIIKETSSKINKEDLMYKTYTDIDELEKKRTEEFKKAVEEWRKGKSSRPNTAYSSQNNKMTSEMGTHINAQVPERTKKLLYCWNCYKQFFEGEGVSKEYTNNFELNTKYNMKNFCCVKCIKEYERKQRSQYICFQCGKMFDLVGGFIAYEGEKFCTGTCKNNYIQEAKENLKNYKKEDKKNKKENKDKVQKKEKINENEDDEVDNYDPMDDF
jgi:hypothetical protein